MRVPLLMGSVLFAGCVAQPSLAPETSATSGQTAALTATEPMTTTAMTSTGSETGGGACGPQEFDIVGHCYRRINAPGPTSIRAAEAADFDGDDATDVAVICRGEVEVHALCVLALNAGGGVKRLDLGWLTDYTHYLSVADFNEDGRPDILVSDMYHFAAFSVDVSGISLISELTYEDGVHDPLDEYMYPARPIDVDQDGTPEIVAGSGFAGMRLYRFDDTSSEWEPVGERLSLFGCGDVADARVADLNGDDVPELVAIGSHNNCGANTLPGSAWNRVSVFAASGGELVPAGDFAIGIAARKLDIADFDGDQIRDLVVGSVEDMMVFVGVGDRTFGKPILVPGLTGFNGTGPHAADFNLDGINEVLVEQDDYSYHLLMGLPEPALVTMPDYMQSVALVKDVDDDGRPDIVSRAVGSGDTIQLVLTLSGPSPMI